MADGYQQWNTNDAVTATKLDKMARRVVIDGSTSYIAGLTKLEGQVYWDTTLNVYKGYDGTNLFVIGGRRIGCTLTSNGAQSISNASDTLVSWGDRYEDSDGFSGATGTAVPMGSPITSLTIPTGMGGTYSISWGTNWSAGVGTGGYQKINRQSGVELWEDAVPAASGSVGVSSVTLPLDDGDSVEFKVAQTSGGTLTMTAKMHMYRISA